MVAVILEERNRDSLKLPVLASSCGHTMEATVPKNISTGFFMIPGGKESP